MQKWGVTLSDSKASLWKIHVDLHHLSPVLRTKSIWKCTHIWHTYQSKYGTHIFSLCTHIWLSIIWNEISEASISSLWHTRRSWKEPEEVTVFQKIFSEYGTFLPFIYLNVTFLLTLRVLCYVSSQWPKYCYVPQFGPDNPIQGLYLPRQFWWCLVLIQL